jgi:hypothetical protein
MISNSGTDARRLLCVRLLRCMKQKKMEALLLNIQGIEKAIILMVIHLCFPELRSECQSVSDIPLSGFRSLSKIKEYVKNIIDNGVSSEMRGRIFILGRQDKMLEYVSFAQRNFF